MSTERATRKEGCLHKGWIRVELLIMNGESSYTYTCSDCGAELTETWKGQK